jgi:hypothetical protein
MFGSRRASATPQPIGVDRIGRRTISSSSQLSHQERGMGQNIYLSDPGNLYTMDCATGSTRLIGRFAGAPFITDIALVGCDGMYGCSFTDIYKIDLNTAAATLIGPVGGISNQVNALEMAADGTLFAADAKGQLFTINTTTGAGTFIGNYGAGNVSAGDLAFDSNGVLYASIQTGGVGGLDQLATVNPATGAATVIGPFGFTNVYGIDFYCCHMFAGTASGEILVVNPFTGAGTQIGSNGINISGMSARSCCGC